MKHFYCDFRFQHLNLHKKQHILFLLVTKSEILQISVIIESIYRFHSREPERLFFDRGDGDPVRRNQQQFAFCSSAPQPPPPTQTPQQLWGLRCATSMSLKPHCNRAFLFPRERHEESVSVFLHHSKNFSRKVFPNEDFFPNGNRNYII